MKIWRIFFLLFLTINLINAGPFNKAVGSGKKSKIISIGPTFIPESRVNKHDDSYGKMFLLEIIWLYENLNAISKNT